MYLDLPFDQNKDFQVNFISRYLKTEIDWSNG